MPRSIDYRSASARPAETVYAVMVDPDFLRARLSALGGPRAALVEHSADSEQAHYVLRHGLDHAVLPAAVRQLVGGELVIERTERLHREAPGCYTGHVDVRMPGTPGSVTGTIRLSDRSEGGSELRVRLEVTVRVPLVGGRIEEMAAEQVRNLLAAETAFTTDWLTRG